MGTILMREIKAGDFVRAQEILRFARDTFKIPDIFSVRIARAHSNEYDIPTFVKVDEDDSFPTYDVEKIQLETFVGEYEKVRIGYGPKSNVLAVFEKGEDSE